MPGKFRELAEVLIKDNLREVRIEDPKAFASSGLDKDDKEDVAYHNGTTAKRNGLSVDDNPHDIEKEPSLHTSWKTGHSDYRKYERRQARKD